MTQSLATQRHEDGSDMEQAPADCVVAKCDWAGTRAPARRDGATAEVIKSIVKRGGPALRNVALHNVALHNRALRNVKQR
jgi:hypothetical protein